jgi:hypothetical protein
VSQFSNVVEERRDLEPIGRRDEATASREFTLRIKFYVRAECDPE